MVIIKFQEHQYAMLKRIHNSKKYPPNAAIRRVLSIKKPQFPIEVQVRNQEFMDLQTLLTFVSSQGTEDEATKKTAGNWWISNYKIVACPKFSPQNPDWTVCTCACHREQGITHVVACCAPCPLCGERIMTGCETEHAKTC